MFLGLILCLVLLIDFLLLLLHFRSAAMFVIGFLCIFDLLLCLVFLENYLLEFLLYLDLALMFDFVFNFTVLFCFCLAVVFLSCLFCIVHFAGLFSGLILCLVLLL